MCVRGYAFDAFLSHTWGDDELGRDNHARVAVIGRLLRERFNISIWLDEEQLQYGDHLWKRLTDGVVQCPLFVVFLTQRYIEKANGDGPNGSADNVFHEFNAACQRQKIIIPIVMEPDIDWRGHAGTVLYPLFRVYLTTDESVHQNIAGLADSIQQNLAKISSRQDEDPVTIDLRPPPMTLHSRSSSQSSIQSCSPVMDFVQNVVDRMSLCSHVCSFSSFGAMSIASIDHTMAPSTSHTRMCTNPTNNVVVTMPHHMNVIAPPEGASNPFVLDKAITVIPNEDATMTTCDHAQCSYT